MAIPSLTSYALPQAAALPVNRVQWQVEPARAVLLVHDMQEYFANFYGKNSKLMSQLQENIASLRHWAKANRIPIVYTAQPIEQSSSQRALLNDMWGPGLTTADPALSEIVTALAPEPDDLVLVKWRYSAFQRSSLQTFMQEEHRDQLLICGIYAHIGCMTTALEAFMLDIKPFMIADAVADFSEEDHLMALNYVSGRCGMVISLNDLVSSTAEQPQLSQTDLHQRVLALLYDDIAEIDPDDNLLDYGLDSVQVMTLISEWQQRGITIQFEELARNPSLNAWWSLIQARQELL